jgi:hypothetical protein
MFTLAVPKGCSKKYYFAIASTKVGLFSCTRASKKITTNGGIKRDSH